MTHMSHLRAAIAALAVIALAACGGSGSSGTGSTPPPKDVGSGTLTGAGATFPEPFYTKVFYNYNQKYPKVSVNYQAIGSGGGIQQFTKGTVQFGASDVPMTEKELAAAGGPAKVLQFPSTIGVVAMAYNLPSVSRLTLDGATIAGIYLGTIKKWNDPALAALNSGVSLPGTSITVVHRSDGSGTSYAFTDYLSTQSPDWQAKVGKGKSVNWPTGIGASGNTGVANGVQQTEGAIGYVELAYVVQAKMQSASVRNKAGKAIQPSADGCSLAAAGIKSSIDPNTSFSIVNQPGDATYPLCSLSWVITQVSYADAPTGKAIAYLWQYVISNDGQVAGKALEYAPLPKEIQDYSNLVIKKIQAAGAPAIT